MKCCVHVHGCTVSAAGINVAIEVSASNGVMYSTDATVPFASSVVQINNAIKNAVIATAGGQGAPGLTATDIVVFGGPA